MFYFYLITSHEVGAMVKIMQNYIELSDICFFPQVIRIEIYCVCLK